MPRSSPESFYFMKHLFSLFPSGIKRALKASSLSQILLHELPLAYRRSWNGLSNWLGEGTEETLFQDGKKQFHEKNSSRKVVLAIFPSQREENQPFFISIPTFGSYRTQTPRWSVLTINQLVIKNVIYNFHREYTRRKVLFPGTYVPVFMLRVDCSLFTWKPARSSPYLPTHAGSAVSLLVWLHNKDDAATSPIAASNPDEREQSFGGDTVRRFVQVVKWDPGSPVVSISVADFLCHTSPLPPISIWVSQTQI